MKKGVKWLYCVPALTIVFGLSLYPLIQTFYLSFTNATLLQESTPTFDGLKNYLNLLGDPNWWSAWKNTLLFAGVTVGVESALGLTIALLLNREFPGRFLLKTAVLIPWAIPSIISAKMWAWMLNDFYGVINTILVSLGWIRAPISWLGDQRYSLWVICVVDIWKSTPFIVLILTAALQTLPTSLMEAAKLDKASFWSQFSKIIFPWIKPTFFVAVLFRLLDALRVFDIPYVLTSNSTSTAVVSTYIRQQLIDFQEVGFGSAASIVFFTQIACLLFLFIRLSQRGQNAGL